MLLLPTESIGIFIAKAETHADDLSLATGTLLFLLASTLYETILHPDRLYDLPNTFSLT